MLKPAILNKNGKIYMAVPPCVYEYFVHNSLDMQGVIIRNHIHYLHIERLADPELNAYLLNRVSTSN